jgi:hypothetical protein
MALELLIKQSLSNNKTACFAPPPPSPFGLNKPIAEQNFVLGQPPRPARKRAGSCNWPRGTY